MICPYNNETQTRWDRGGYRVQLNVPGNSRPIGFCDGTELDEAELKQRSEAEGAEGLRIEKKVLKSGRELWTLYSDAGS